MDFDDLIRWLFFQCFLKVVLLKICCYLPLVGVGGGTVSGGRLEFYYAMIKL